MKTLVLSFSVSHQIINADKSDYLNKSCSPIWH
jgi:hypothetical protein